MSSPPLHKAATADPGVLIRTERQEEATRDAASKIQAVQRGKHQRGLQRARTFIKQQETVSRETAARLEVQRDAMRFAQADVNDDMQLDWDEFYQMQPLAVRKKHSVAEIRRWFEEADGDRSGTVSINEFFHWTMLKFFSHHGGLHAIEAIFRTYDNDQTGTLDELEFSKFCEDVGFGTASHDIFLGLDTDNSGYVSYRELLGSLTTEAQRPAAGDSRASSASSSGPTPLLGKSPKSPKSPTKGSSLASAKQQQFLMALAWTDNDMVARRHAGDERAEIDTSRWRLDATDGTALLEQVHRHFVASGGSVVGMLDTFNFTDPGEVYALDVLSITLSEFAEALRTRCGYVGDDDVVRSAFEKLDTDRSGFIDQHELFEFLTGRLNALRRARPKMADLEAEAMSEERQQLAADDDVINRLRFVRKGALHLYELTEEDDDAWTRKDLRRELQRMLIHHHVTPDVLLRAWDRDKSGKCDGKLAKRNYLQRMKGLCADAQGCVLGDNLELWDERIRPTAVTTFDMLADTKERAINMKTFSQFLNKSWPLGSTTEGAPAMEGVIPNNTLRVDALLDDSDHGRADEAEAPGSTPSPQLKPWQKSTKFAGAAAPSFASNRRTASAPRLPRLPSRTSLEKPIWFYQNGNFVQAGHQVRALNKSRGKDTAPQERWKRPPTPATHIPRPGEVGSLSSYRLRPIGQGSSAVAWDAPWGWDHGRLGGAGRLTAKDAAYLGGLNTKRAHLRARPQQAEGLWWGMEL